MYRILFESTLPMLSFIITFFVTTNFLRSQNHSKFSDLIRKKIDKQMVQVNSGYITLGNPDQPEGKRVKKWIATFKISRFEVSNELFKLFVDSMKQEDSIFGFWNSYYDNTAANHPVHCVTYTEAQEFIEWLNKVTGESYRLPSEAEWEKAAKCGKKCNFSQYDGEFDSTHVNCYSHQLTTVPIDSLPCNDWKIHNMSGNVWEWVAESSEKKITATGSTIKLFMLKGGSYINQAKDCTTFSRHYLPTNVRAISCGFRLAKSIN